MRGNNKDIFFELDGNRKNSRKNRVIGKIEK
jgi:hypothetical protein